MRRQYSGRFNVRTHPALWEPADRVKTMGGGLVKLNGSEVKQVFAADTKEGFVRTFDVFRDGKAHSTHGTLSAGMRPEDFSAREVEFELDGAVTETLRGQVEIWGPEER